jgi:hypothetical protein
MRAQIVTFTSAAVLAGAGLLWAQTPTPHQHPTPPEEASQPGMTGDEMMEECKAMMAKRQAMHEQAAAMDAKLDTLVTAMDQTSGEAKVDATAAVVSELVAQRKVMRESMEAMHPMMMEHMMKHMQAGSMAGCPMMGGGEEGGEHGHH